MPSNDSCIELGDERTHVAGAAAVIATLTLATAGVSGATTAAVGIGIIGGHTAYRVIGRGE